MNKDNIKSIFYKPNSSITVVLLETTAKQVGITADNPNFKEAEQALHANNREALLAIIDKPTAIQNILSKIGSVEVTDNEVIYDGKSLRGSLVSYIIALANQGMDLKPATEFLKKVYNNPSMDSIDDLWNFIDRHGLSLTDDGNFVGYKSVRPNNNDWHTNSILNGPGVEPTPMKREDVTKDRNIACSKGYHVGSLGYANTFMDSSRKILLVEVDPEDVVSVPLDCEQSKIRVRKYRGLAWLMNPETYDPKTNLVVKK
jgi:hypothetical protein